MKPTLVKKRYYRCGDESHLANRCRFRLTVCNTCNVRGHISRVCRNKCLKRPPLPINNVPTDPAEDKVQNTSVSDADVDTDNYHIHYVYKKTKPYTTCLTIDQKDPLQSLYMYLVS